MGDFSLTSPNNEATDVSTSPTLTWDSMEVFPQIAVYVYCGTNPTPEYSQYDRSVDTGVDQLALSGLSLDTLYYWGVLIEGDGGSTFMSDVWSFTTESGAPTPPDVPVLTFPADNSTGVSTQPDFTWNAASGATSYSLQVATDQNFSNLVLDQTEISATHYVISQLLGQAYYWRVRSKSADDLYSDWSSVLEFTTVPNVPVIVLPDPDANLHPSRPCVFTWNSIVGITKYDLQVSKNADFSSPEVDVALTNVVTYSVNLQGNVDGTICHYYYRIRSESASGVKSSWMSSNFDTFPRTVHKFEPANAAVGVPVRPDFVWGRMAEAHHYKIEIATNVDFSNIVFEDSNVAQLPLPTQYITYTLPVDLVGTIFYWRVCQYSAVISDFDPFSIAYRFSIVQMTIDVPTPLLPSSKTTLPVSFKWTSVSNDVTYHLQVVQEQEFYHHYINQPNLTANSYTSTEALPIGKICYWRVKAKRGELSGAWSAVQSFVVVSCVNKEKLKVVTKAIVARRKANPGNFGWSHLSIKFKK